ncbi:hypothetical protein [Candidatus Macondimonas diazotrophica]|jgi:hypothetical protein|uniref:Uncharacterized protein n=1 Tax=Candidatus Macondimonas diazotrophica TaxID=2305248 RepID=A0A4Z0F786_9GAMM|nr:hypothetical protein [Candidatus Macondimonas diazotrophica]TFZ81247.1 hypothetical protein E4680_13280 [Candidatus Macondimonas diazotrophica]
MHYIELLKVFVQVLPLIIDLVKKLDDLPSSEGTGADKLQIVLDAVKAAVTQAKELGVSWDKLEPMIKAAVESILRIIRR